MAETVKFNIRIDDNGTFKKIEVDAEDVKKAIRTVKEEADKLNASIVNWAQAGQAAEQLATSVGQLFEDMKSLSDEYSLQEVASAKLSQVMRNMMAATDEEIRSVEELCATQEKLGVVEGDVQIAAAQELATYLTLSSSLKAIIPVMNDMIAQQLGIGASAESATQIATMLGKVMDGQTEALSRYGYKFSEAQKYILQYGEEAERAAVLTEVISESVGGMNQALAQTDAGRLEQINFKLGEVKENLGGIIQGAMPLVTLFAEFTIATSGVTRLYLSFRSLSAALGLASIKSMALATHQRILATAQSLLGASGITAAAGTTALNVAVTALYATLTMGISLVITGLISLFGSLSNKSKDAAEGVDMAAESADAYKQASLAMRSELAMEIVKLEELIKKKGQEADKVKELNNKYGDVFGVYNTAQGWYDTLISKSADYCKQLGLEAKAQVLAKQSGDRQMQLDAVRQQMKELESQGKGEEYKVETTKSLKYGFVTNETKTEYGELKDQEAALVAEVAALDQEFRNCITGAKTLADTITGGNNASTKSVSWTNMSYSQLGKAIRDQKDTVEGLIGVDDIKAKRENALLKQMEKRYNLLGKIYGLESSSNSKNKYDGSTLIKEASSYNEVSNNLKYYQELLAQANMADQEKIQTIYREIIALQNAKKAFEDLQAEAERPSDLNSLENIDKEIAYQQALRKKASAEKLKEIDAEIKRLNTLKLAFEGSFNPEKGLEQITTFEQLDVAISYYSEALNQAGEKDRESLQKTINTLEEMKQKWEETLDLLRRPGEISTLNTVEELDDAIDYYSTIQGKASAQEISDIQRTIDALQEKRALLMGISAIPTEQANVVKLEGLSGKKLKIELEAIGLDGIRQKIKSLQELLNNTKIPLNSQQRQEVSSLIDAYSEYEKTLIRSNVSVAQGWGYIKGIGGSVRSLTEDLKGDGTAWDKVCSAIDNMIGLTQSFAGIVEIIKALTGVSQTYAAAKQAEGAAALTAGAQAVAGAGMEVAASGAVSTARATETTANVAAAASGAMAAHSAIPFVGVAIGAAFVASILAIMSSLPKFANGCIAYGPTLGLFGEYAGAANNPEVVAPLNKLKALIGDSGGDGKVEFVISGRVLKGFLEKETRRSYRTNG